MLLEDAIAIARRSLYSEATHKKLSNEHKDEAYNVLAKWHSPLSKLERTFKPKEKKSDY